MGKMKAPNGYGSIEDLGKGRRKRWGFRIFVGYKPNGKPDRPYVAYFEKWSEANDFRTMYNSNPDDFRLIEENKKKTLVKVKIPTVKELIDTHIATYESLGKAEKTINTYRTAKQYFEDIFDEPIDMVKASHVQDIINELIDDGLSYSSVNKVKITYSQICKIAMGDDYIDKNYATLLKLPKQSKPDNRVFKDFEVEKILDYALTNDIAKIIAIFIYTGVRPGIMLKTSRFKVYPDKRYMVAGGKTEAGTDRIIPIHDKILPFVEYFYKKSKSEHLFTLDGKEPYKYRSFSDEYYKALDELGVQRLNPHKCRKTALTMMRRAGIEPDILQKLAGHKDINITIKYYFAELEPEELKNAIDSVS